MTHAVVKWGYFFKNWLFDAKQLIKFNTYT